MASEGGDGEGSGQAQAAEKSRGHTTSGRKRHANDFRLERGLSPKRMRENSGHADVNVRGALHAAGTAGSPSPS